MTKSSQSQEELIAFVEGLKRQWVASIDALVDPLMIVNENYTISKANKSMAEFCEAKNIPSIIGKKCYQTFASRKKPCEGCELNKATKSEKPVHFNLENIRGKYFEVTSQPLFSPSGKIEGCVQIYRDRTDAKALQKQLIQSEKLASIGLLAGGIAHEINNPLGGILIFSQMILKEMEKNSSFYEDVVEIEAAAQRCKSIVSRLLDFARCQPDDIRGKKQILVDISQAANSALRFAQVHSHAKKIQIEELWDNQQSFFVKGDRNHFIQLFLNLMQNAIQSMPNGGILRLKSSREIINGEAWGTWEIEDTGIGIQKSHLDRIFDPFFTTKEPGEGTGLGLSICYGTCKEAGGKLEVESEINVGTVFKIKLPLENEKIES